MSWSRRQLFLTALLQAHAQQSTFLTDVRVVTLLVTVRDSDGHLVTDLTQEDFELWEEEQPQTIRYFQRESDLPLTLGLLVDTSKSQKRVLEAERQASYLFLDQVLQEGIDRAFVLHFDEKVELLQGLTSSRAELAAALARLRMPRHEDTLLYQAVRDASESVMRSQTGRKAFIVLTDGGNQGGKTSLGTAIEFAQQADTMVYTIMFAERGVISLSPVAIAVYQIYLAHGRKVLRRLANETGGEYFEVTKADPLTAIYTRIEEELRHQYSLGYVPVVKDGEKKRYRKLRVRAKRDGLRVQTRDGYYAH